MIEHFSLSMVFQLYIRMMGYGTVFLCSLFSIKMGKTNNIVLLGNAFIGLMGIIGAIDTRINGGQVGGLVFTIGVFIWMVCNLINTLQILKK